MRKYTELSLDFNYKNIQNFSQLMSYLAGPFAEQVKNSQYMCLPQMFEAGIKKVSMLETEECVSLLTSSVVSGLSKNGKPFWRWQSETQVSFSFKGRKNGKPVFRIYGCRSPKGNPYNMVYQNTRDLDHSPVAFQAVMDMYKRVLGVDCPYEGKPRDVLYQMAFPSKDLRPTDTPTYYSNEMPPVPGIQAATPNEAVLEMFGKKRYRKDLVKAYVEADGGSIITAYTLRGLVPTDYLVKIMKEGVHLFERFSNAPDSRKSLSMLSEHQLKRLVTLAKRSDDEDGYYGDCWLVDDILKSIRHISDIVDSYDFSKLKFRTITEFHNDLANIARRIEHPDRPIEPTEFSDRLNTIDWNKYGLAVQTASSTHQVENWGDKMNHCIASYNSYALEGTVVLVGIYRDGELVGNSSFTQERGTTEFRCDQILGKYNRHLPDRLAFAFKDAIIEADVLPEWAFDNVWGLARSTAGLV